MPASEPLLGLLEFGVNARCVLGYARSYVVKLAVPVPALPVKTARTCSTARAQR